MSNNTIHGIGLGLRFEHFDDILNSKPDIPWFEVLVEDFLVEGPHHTKLLRLRDHYPIIFHSVGLNLCGLNVYEKNHLNKYLDLYNKFEPAHISDHLCWSSYNSNYHHDLMPFPKNKESLKHASSRISYLQDHFKRPLMVENITSYVEFKSEEYSEIEFLTQLTKTTGCSLLLDITNITINSANTSIDPIHYINNFPLTEVQQIHLSGPTDLDGTLLDSHSSSVRNDDIEILKMIYDMGYKIPAMIERDSNIPAFADIRDEVFAIKEAVQ